LIGSYKQACIETATRKRRESANLFPDQFRKRLITASFTNQKANTGCNSKYWHQYTESAERNTREAHHSHHDEINGKQQDADIPGLYKITVLSPCSTPVYQGPDVMSSCHVSK